MEEDGAALVDELEPGLRVRDALDRRDPGARPAGRRRSRGRRRAARCRPAAGRSSGRPSDSSWAIRRPSTEWKAAGIVAAAEEHHRELDAEQRVERRRSRCSRPRPRPTASGRAGRHRSWIVFRSSTGPAAERRARRVLADRGERPTGPYSASTRSRAAAVRDVAWPSCRAAAAGRARSAARRGRSGAARQSPVLLRHDDVVDRGGPVRLRRRHRPTRRAA